MGDQKKKGHDSWGDMGSASRKVACTQSVRPSASQLVREGHRVNQHPPPVGRSVHRMGLRFFIRLFTLRLTNIVPQSTFFGCWSLALFSFLFFVLFLLNPSFHITLPPSYLIDLATHWPTSSPTYQLTLNPLPTYHLSLLGEALVVVSKKFISSWLNTYLLTKPLSS